VKAPGHFIPRGYRVVRYGEPMEADDICAGRKFWGELHKLPLSESRPDLIGKTISVRGVVGTLVHNELRNRICRKKASVIAPARAMQNEVSL
jgi:hypothetical protein